MSCQNILELDGESYQCQNKTSTKYCQHCLNNVFQYRCEKTITRDDHVFRCTNMTANEFKICNKCNKF